MLQAKEAQDGSGQKPTGAKRPRMSTAVDLPAVSTSKQDAGHARKKQKAINPQDPLSVSLSAFPAEMQRYMQAEGYLEPSPIQER